MIIHDVEQNTDEWLALRAGKPTASEFSKLVTSTGAPSKSMNDYARVLAAEAYAGHAVDKWEGNQYTDRGKSLEAEARAWYELYKGVDVEEVGFVTDDLNRYGCSPDGLVGPGCVEFKCQIAKEHIKSLEYWAKNNKPPTAYVAQCQGQIFVCEREWVDLVFYHPDLPSLIIRQTPQHSFISALKHQLQAVEAERNVVLKFLKGLNND